MYVQVYLCSYECRCINMFGCEWTCMDMYGHACGEAWGPPWVLLLRTPPCFLRRDLSLAWKSMSGRGCLAKELQGSTFLYFPSDNRQEPLCLHAQLFMWVLGLELKSVILAHKHFIDWAFPWSPDFCRLTSCPDTLLAVFVRCKTVMGSPQSFK